MVRRETSTEKFEREYVLPKPGRTLIVGSHIYSDRQDRRKLYPDALGVDLTGGPGVDRVLDLEEKLPTDIGKFTHVECISVLEHSRRPWLLARNVEKLLEPGGTLYVQAPFVWRIHDYGGDLWRFSKDGIRALFRSTTFHALMYAHDRLKGNDMISTVEVDGHPFLARTEVCGFGVRE